MSNIRQRVAKLEEVNPPGHEPLSGIVRIIINNDHSEAGRIYRPILQPGQTSEQNYADYRRHCVETGEPVGQTWDDYLANGLRMEPHHEQA